MYKNIIPLFSLLAELGNVVDRIRAAIKAKTGVVAAMARIFDLSDEVGALFSVEWSKVDDEFKASRAEGHKTVAAALKTKFDIQNDRAEDIIEEGIEIIGALDVFVTRVISWVGRLTKK